MAYTDFCFNPCFESDPSDLDLILAALHDYRSELLCIGKVDFADRVQELIYKHDSWYIDKRL